MLDSSSPESGWTRKVLSLLPDDIEGGAHALEQRYGPHLHQCARHLMQEYRLRQVEAEDLVQETWSEALGGRCLPGFEYRHTGSLLLWLKSILRNRAKDHLRRQRTCKRGANATALSCDEAGEGLHPVVSSHEPSPTSGARYAEYLELCKHVLSPREWDAWRLMELEGRTSEEVAETLGTTGAAIRGLVHRARSKIVEALSSRERPERNSGGDLHTREAE